jgi:hypothetical protein
MLSQMEPHKPRSLARMGMGDHKEEAMNRREILCLAAITLSGTVLLIGSAVSQQRTLKDQLVGNWSFVSGSIEGKDGKKTAPWGTDPIGTLTFTNDGHFTLINERPTAQRYNGTYTVDDAKKTLSRRYEGSSEYTSAINLTGDELKLVDQDPAAGKTELVYKRAK